MKKLAFVLYFCIGCPLLMAQEIVQIPQGKNKPFPDIERVKQTFQQLPYNDYPPYEYTSLMQTIAKEDLDTVTELVQQGADVNEGIENEFGGPTSDPLLVGVFSGNKKIVSYLLNNGALPKDANQVWEVIIGKNLQEIAPLLLAKGIYPEAEALRKLVVLNKPELLKLILREDKALSKQQKNEILDMARKWTQHDIVSLLDSNYQRLQKALREKDIKIIQDIISSEGMNPIIYAFFQAAERGNLSSIQTLFQTIPNLQTEYTDIQGNTPLMYAVIYGHLDIVQFLLEKGAQADITVSFMDRTAGGNYIHPEYEYQEGWNVVAYTALMKAAERNDQKMIDLLLKHGAKDRLLVLPGTTMEGPHLRTVSAGVNQKCSRHRHAHYWLYGGPGEPYPVTTEPWEKECDFPTESQVYHYFFDNFKP